MKTSTKLALLALGLGTAVSARAYTYGDVMVGFTGGSTDFIYDLGPYTSLISQSWNVGANLGTRFGAVGATALSGTLAQNIFATSSDPSESGYLQGANWSGAKANVQTIGTGLSLAGQSRTTTTSDTTGWHMQTDQPAGTPGNFFFNNYFNPNIAVGSTAYLFDNYPNSGGRSLIGMFTYDNAHGTLNFIAVPEPATTSLLAGFALLAFLVRRQFTRL